MADIELQGRIDFNADTDKVATEVGKASEASGKDFGQSFGKSITDSIKKMMQNVFGNNEVAKKFGTDVGKSIGESILQHAKNLVNSLSPPKITPLTSGGGFQVPSWGIPGAAATGAGSGAAGQAAAQTAAFARVASMAGPLALAVGAIVIAIGATAIAFYKITDTLIDLTKRLIEFSRTLAEVSPSMAMVFAQFDLQMMMLKRDLGESLAPIIGHLLRNLSSLAQSLLPAITFTLSRFGAFIGLATDYIVTFVSGLKILIQKLASIPGFKAVTGAVADTAAGVTGMNLPLAIFRTVDEAARLWMGDRAANRNTNVLGAFTDYLNRDASQQSAASRRLHQSRSDRNHDLKEGVEVMDFRLRGT